MKILFFGLGSIGTKHAKLLKENFDHELYAFRTSGKPNKLGITEIRDLDEIDQIKPDIAFITNPTSEHVKYALLCASKGMDLFIEKPLSHTREGIEELDEMIKKNNVKVYVGYCLRFHPVIKKLKTFEKPLKASITCSSYLPDWNSNDHLKSYSARKELGGGVILDLSHEIDYAYHLFGYPNLIKAKASKLSHVTVDTEDNAYIVFDFGGMKCDLHLDFMTKQNKRQIVLDYGRKKVVGDLIKNTITTYENETSSVETLPYVKGQMFLDQLHYFFQGSSEWEEAKKLFDIIMQIKELAGQD